MLSSGLRDLRAVGLTHPAPNCRRHDFTRFLRYKGAPEGRGEVRASTRHAFVADERASVLDLAHVPQAVLVDEALQHIELA